MVVGIIAGTKTAIATTIRIIMTITKIAITTITTAMIVVIVTVKLKYGLGIGEGKIKKSKIHLEIYSFNGVTVRFGFMADQFRFPDGFERTLRTLEVFDIDTPVFLHQVVRMNEI